MSILDEKRDELEHYEFMMGMPRGRLAVAMDVLTDALTLVGQHGVYCQSARQIGKPAMDIQIVMKGITDAKELISSVMEEIRKQKEAGN
jgi:hypothetical protein